MHGKKGIFGHLSAYFGVIKSQGHGTLHLHILLWLQNDPSLSKMHKLLKAEDFHMKVKEFIKANIWAYLPGIETQDSMKALLNEVEIGYSHPPHPLYPNNKYEAECQDYECQIAHAKQVHVCELWRCLKVDWNGVLVCKHRAPFETSNKHT